MRITLAFRLFFKTLFDGVFASRVTEVLDSPSTPRLPASPAEAPKQQPAREPEKRSDALTLLATLQREARFIDMIKEPLTGFSDAQVGAAARDVLRDCGEVIDRMFGIEPLSSDQEGSSVEVSKQYDAGRIRLTGNVSGEPPFKGKLVHHGWIAARCEVPKWSGSEAARQVIAPQEVELP